MAQQKQQPNKPSRASLMVGSGDRSERIRTYNFPQGRLTDHRINLTLYKLGEIMEGHLDEVVQPLVQEHQAEALAALGVVAVTDASATTTPAHAHATDAERRDIEVLIAHALGVDRAYLYAHGRDA